MQGGRSSWQWRTVLYLGRETAVVRCRKSRRRTAYAWPRRGSGEPAPEERRGTAGLLERQYPLVRPQRPLLPTPDPGWEPPVFRWGCLVWGLGFAPRLDRMKRYAGNPWSP